jgi:hypothetical protein
MGWINSAAVAAFWTIITVSAVVSAAIFLRLGFALRQMRQDDEQCAALARGRTAEPLTAQDRQEARRRIQAEQERSLNRMLYPTD